MSTPPLTRRSSLLILLPHHLDDLRSSGLSSETINRWGCYSIDTDQKGVLNQLGFGHIDPPALAFPILPPDRNEPDLNNVMLKPDVPRQNGSERACKYEARPKSRNRLHVPLGIRDKIRDLAVALVITEGQKKAEKAAQEGICTIALAGVWNWKDRIGESSFPSPDFELIPLEHRQVLLCFDSDAISNPNVRQAERDLALFLTKKFRSHVKIKRLPPGADDPKVGLDDFLVSHHTAEQFWNLPEQEPDAAAHTIETPTEQPREEWPQPMADEAFHGPAGEYARSIEPYTEADPAAILAQMLVTFGSLIGRSPYFQVGSTRHYANLFCVLVGETGKGRKGTSWSEVRHSAIEMDQNFANQIQSGLSSGEGVVWAVHDEIEKQDPIKKAGQLTGYQKVVVNESVADKRILVIETEFSSPLRVASRDGNTLSCVIREAWDYGDLRLLTKNSPVRATGAHISIIGHITNDELTRHLTTTDLANGFANRFLWVCVRRSKCLPDSADIPQEKIAPIVRRIAEASEFAKSTGKVVRDAQARDLWHEVYPELSEGGFGLLGAATNRAEAQVVRLAMVYALLDRSATIGIEHLRAALAFWEYCADSARFIFGDAFGDPVVDSVLEALRGQVEGMTRTEISNHFGRHQSSDGTDRALRILVSKGFVIHKRDNQTGGRPSERWVAVSRLRDKQ